MKALLALLVVVVLGLVVGDRFAASAAERLLARQVAAQLPQASVEATVRTPFLPQFARGRYDDVVVEARGPLQGVEVDRAVVTVVGARIPPGDALRRDVSRVPVDGLRVEAAVPYAEVTRLAGQGLTVEPAQDGRVRVSGEVEVLGTAVSAAAVSRLELVEGGLRVTPERFETGADVADDLLERVAGDRFSFTVDPGALPLGLRPSGVRATADGVVLTAQAGPTVLEQGRLPAGSPPS